MKQITISLNMSFASNKNMKFEVRHVKWLLLKGALYEPQVSLANVTRHPPMRAMVPGAHMKPPPPPGVPPSALAPGLQQKVASKQRPASRLHYLPIFPAAIWGPLPVFPAYVLAHAAPPLPPTTAAAAAATAATARPLVDPSMCPATASSLTHECGQGKAPLKAWTPTEGSRICNSNLWPTLYRSTPPPPTHPSPPTPHPPSPSALRPGLSPVWLRTNVWKERHRCEVTRFHTDPTRAHAPWVFSWYHDIKSLRKSWCINWGTDCFRNRITTEMFSTKERGLNPNMERRCEKSKIFKDIFSIIWALRVLGQRKWFYLNLLDSAHCVFVLSALCEHIGISTLIDITFDIDISWSRTIGFLVIISLLTLTERSKTNLVQKCLSLGWTRLLRPL